MQFNMCVAVLGFFSPQKNFSTQLIIKVYGAIFTFSTDAAAAEGRQANTGLGEGRRKSLQQTKKKTVWGNREAPDAVRLTFCPGA